MYGAVNHHLKIKLRGCYIRGKYGSKLAKAKFNARRVQTEYSNIYDNPKLKRIEAHSRNKTSDRLIQ